MDAKELFETLENMPKTAEWYAVVEKAAKAAMAKLPSACGPVTINEWLRDLVPANDRVRYRYPLVRELHRNEPTPPRRMFAEIAADKPFDVKAIKEAFERLERDIRLDGRVDCEPER